MNKTDHVGAFIAKDKAARESRMTARILWHVALDTLRRVGVPVDADVENMRHADADALFAFADTIGETDGYAEGEARAAFIDFLMVRDNAATAPDEAAEADALRERYGNAARALLALQECTGAEPDADDVGMVLNASASDRGAWADDLEARCGLDVQAFRAALRAIVAGSAN